jgi:hypothetical protein
MAAPPPGSGYLVISQTRLLSLPTSGPAWSNVMSTAALTLAPKLSDQDNQADVQTLAQALVYARTGDPLMRTRAVNALIAVQGTEAGARELAIARGLGAYILAADLIGYHDPGFVSWVGAIRSASHASIPGTDTLRQCAGDKANNWGTWCRAALLSADLYLGDAGAVAEDVRLFRAYLGDDPDSVPWVWVQNATWQCDPNHRVPINPVGCTTSGHDIGGVINEDQARSGNFKWPPPCENYVAEALQGVTLEAVLLERLGDREWARSDSAIERTVLFRETNGCHFTGDDSGTPWVIDHAYGLGLSASTPALLGKGWGFQDWLFMTDPSSPGSGPAATWSSLPLLPGLVLVLSFALMVPKRSARRSAHRAAPSSAVPILLPGIDPPPARQRAPARVATGLKTGPRVLGVGVPWSLVAAMAIQLALATIPTLAAISLALLLPRRSASRSVRGRVDPSTRQAGEAVPDRRTDSRHEQRDRGRELTRGRDLDRRRPDPRQDRPQPGPSA